MCDFFKVSVTSENDSAIVIFNFLNLRSLYYFISKNKLSHRAEMQRTQINHYCNNEISRLDIDVLARLCTVLDCKIGDLLEFVPVQQVGEE